MVYTLYRILSADSLGVETARIDVNGTEEQIREIAGQLLSDGIICIMMPVA